MKRELLALFSSIINSSFHFENNFDHVNIKNVWSYFKQHLVDTKYLDKVDLEIYLRQGFESKSRPVNKFLFKNVPSKKEIYRVFYLYYKDVAGKPHGKQKNYASLLGDYFEGYSTDTVSTNFSKSYY